MGLKYYSLDHVSVLSVPSVVQSSGPLVILLWRPGSRNQKDYKLHSVTETLAPLLTKQTNAMTDLIKKWRRAV